MAPTDSVSVFAEGTFEEQVQELVNYIVRHRSEEERTAFIRPFQDVLRTEEGKPALEEDESRRKTIISRIISEVNGLGDGTEKEIEGFFNLLYSHLFALFPVGSEEADKLVSSLLQAISSDASDRSFIKYRILSNLFNAIPKNSSLRLPVYHTLLVLASAEDDLDILQLSRADVEKWLKEWDISSEQKSTFIKAIMDAYVKSSQPLKAYEYSLLYIRSLPATSTPAQEAAVEAIASALRLPTVFDFDPLFKLDAVIAAKSHELFTLLQVFLNGGLADFRNWVSKNSSTLEKHDLDEAQLERKIRLLTLASLAFQFIGHDLLYAQVADGLQIEQSQVETWVIDAIRAGIVTGKLSQTAQSFHVIRSTARTFERDQWSALEKRLTLWKSGLAGVLEVVSNAKKQGGSLHVSAQTQTVPT